MTITPQDIQSKQFHVRMRGFDMDEVDKFLEQVAEELLIVSLENKQLLEKIDTMEKELANFRNKEQAFQSAILSAQRISDEMQARSRQEAEEIVITAKKTAEELESRTRLEADALIEKSQHEAKELRVNAEAESRRITDEAKNQHLELTSSINSLIEIKGRIISDLRQLLNNYLDHIDQAVPTGLNALEPLLQVHGPAEVPDHGDKYVSPEEEQPVFSDVTGRLEEDDLEDLYEKIDFPAERRSAPAAADQDQPATLDISDLEPLDFEDEGDLSPPFPIDTIPDDEEMLFSLEDPLDELEPSVSINDDDKID